MEKLKKFQCQGGSNCLNPVTHQCSYRKEHPYFFCIQHIRDHILQESNHSTSSIRKKLSQKQKQTLFQSQIDKSKQYEEQKQKLLKQHQQAIQPLLVQIEKLHQILAQNLKNLSLKQEKYMNNIYQTLTYGELLNEFKNIELLDSVVINPQGQFPFRGLQCSFCSCDLKRAQVQFLCIECQPAFFLCENCRQNEHSFHAMFQIRQSSDLTGVRQEFFEPGFSQVLKDQQAYCNMSDSKIAGFCEIQIENVRWKSAQAQDFDFCDSCHTRWVSGDRYVLQCAEREEHFQHHLMVDIRMSQDSLSTR